LRLERIVVRHHRRRVEAKEADLVVPENQPGLQALDADVP
jgi:hypothetical protein